MSGRLSTLSGGNNDTNPKSKTLKFKPKIVQRKTKEEREEALKNLEKERAKQQEDADKKKRREDFFKQQQKNKLSGNRVPKYLQNTTLVSSGPLATGTFSGNFKPGFSNNRPTFSSSSSGSGGRGISSLIKNENTELLLAENGKDSDSDLEDEKDDKDEFNNEGEVKINMGKEYKPEEEKAEDSDSEEDENEKKEGKFELDHLFPVRPIKIKHEDLTNTNIKEEIKQNFSIPGTKENTPEINGQDGIVPTIERMQLDALFYRNNPENNHQQISIEKEAIYSDYLKINKKLHHKKTSKLIQKNLFLYQLPSILPFENDANEPLQGEIGQLRIHKSGKVTMKFSNGTVMDVFKSAETSFLQEVVSIKAPLRDSNQDTNKDIVKVKKEMKDQEDEMDLDGEGGQENDDIGMIEHLGTVTSKYVTVPRL